MRVARLASRRWFRVAMLGLLALGLGALVVFLALEGWPSLAAAMLVAAVPILWLAKSGVELLSTLGAMRRKATEQAAETRQRIEALTEASSSSARSVSILEQQVSAEEGRLGEAVRRVEVIEADRIRIAHELDKAQSLLQSATVEIDTLRRGLADLVDLAQAHDSRLARLEPAKRKSPLPAGIKPELNMAWAMGSMAGGVAQVDESKEPGSGGSSDSNA